MPTRARRGWISLLVGVIAVVLGLWLILRPMASLSLLVLVICTGLVVVGVGRAFDAGASTGSRLLGVAGIVLGGVFFFWPNLTMRTLTLAVGVYLIVDGVGDMIDAIRGRTDRRVSGLIIGVATVIFGILALTWPDITVLVIAVVFAARLIVFGISGMVGFFRGDEPAGQTAPGPIRRRLGVLGAIAALIAAGILAVISSRLNSGEPVVDAFYDAPADLPDDPGMLLRVEPFERGIPDGANAWRILYTSTREEGEPAVASGLVVAPEGGGNAPVIAWAHGTTGVDRTCAPSVLEGTFSTGAFFSVEEVIEQGWILVATDYIGLGTESPHPYLIGQGEGRSVLDAVRATRQMDEISIQEPTVVWGHSQGGHAALWTGVLAPTYAPDVNVIGVAALAPASDVIGLVETLSDVTGGSIFASYLVSAYSDIYDDVRLADYMAPGGDVTLRAIASRCLAEPSALTSVLSSVAVDFSIFRGDLAGGSLERRLQENIPPYEIEVPLLLGQGGSDSLITPSVQAGYVDGMCDAGQEVDYRVYEDLGHVPLVEADSPLIPDLIDWTQARLAGDAPLSTC